MYWIHFGAGNIFRGFIAALHQELLDKKITDTKLIAADGYDFEIIDKIYKPYKNKTELVILRGDGYFEHSVIDSISESLVASPERKSDWDRLCKLFASSDLQMVSFTITEKGYTKLENSTIGTLCDLMLHRYESGALPVALVSMDNYSHNGDRLKECLISIAQNRNKPGFVEYLSDPEKVSFPLTMIDKITPNPSPIVQKMLQDKGLKDMNIIKTAKGTIVAPFVNAEKTQYLVVEDWFPNGREPLEKAGVIFTHREIVDKVEKMKVCACLNPLHTALAIFGCLLGFKSIAMEMKDDDLRTLVERMGYEEELPVALDPGVLNPKEFLETVLNERLPNPNLPDTPQRIACDTSQKLPIRFGEAIKLYGNKACNLKFIPLVLAAWLRYRQAIDDEGNPMELSPDPACPEDIFSLVYAIGGEMLKDKIDSYYNEMQGNGAVRACLMRILK
ncbi:MAG: mannitol dehydrogenase family protein [Oscillospiraceae bacterium]|nr:mannitol dehydrogenase family protein [Oscillospiraceae bacterium]